MVINEREICELASRLLKDRDLILAPSDFIVGSEALISSLEAVQFIAMIEELLEDKDIEFIDVFELALVDGECTIATIVERINEAISE